MDDFKSSIPTTAYFTGKKKLYAEKSWKSKSPNYLVCGSNRIKGYFYFLCTSLSIFPNFIKFLWLLIFNYCIRDSAFHSLTFEPSSSWDLMPYGHSLWNRLSCTLSVVECGSVLSLKGHQSQHLRLCRPHPLCVNHWSVAVATNVSGDGLETNMAVFQQYFILDCWVSNCKMILPHTSGMGPL